jgi:hypothetical protein
MSAAWTERNLWQRQRSGGYAILIVVVAVALLVLLYFMDIQAIFGPSVSVKQARPEERPWLEEGLIVAADKLIKLPKPPKPELKEPFRITAPVFFNESERGQVTLYFTAAGEVSGSWYCEYSHESRDYAFDATFTGNIDVTKAYTKNDRVDNSMLYFITKGDYTQMLYNVDTGRRNTEQGLVYVTGWVMPDYSAEGLITITTDKSWSATYNWQSE